MAATETPRRYIGVARLSPRTYTPMDLTDEGIPLGLDDQIKRIHRAIEAVGGVAFKILAHPRLSAYKTRKVVGSDGRVSYRVYRPDLAEALDHLAAGRCTGLMALDLDRAFRDPADLRDLLDLIEHSKHDIVADSTNGSMRLGRDIDSFDAEVRVLVARKASKDTARRVAYARERQARSGKFGGGKRRYCFELDGLTVRPTEAAVIAQAGEDVLCGVPLRTQARDLNAKGVLTVTGSPWAGSTLRDVLLRPRTAGLMVYRGEVIGQAPWDPIIDEDTWRTITAVLTDPHRVRRPGRTHSHLGTGLFQCPCGATLGIQGGDRPLAYRCFTVGAGVGHLRRRNAAAVDRVVVDAVLGYLSGPSAIDLFNAPPDSGVDANALRADARRLRAVKAQLAVQLGNGLLDAEDYAAAKTANARKLDAVVAEIEQAAPASPLAPFAAGESARAVWDALQLGARRRVVGALCTVTVRSTGPGTRFDPRTVEISWKPGVTS